MLKVRRSSGGARFGGAVLFVLCAAYACGSPTRDYGVVDGGGGKAGSTSAGGNSSNGGKSSSGGKAGMSGGEGGLGGAAPEGGTGATTGEGGEGGEIVVPPTPGRPGSALVAGGYYMKSKHYSLMSALGEAPGGNGVYSSKKYVLLGGVVGTTQP
jgi:hypothetical protein